MVANQVQIPYMQTSDSELNLVQQNINKVLRNINNQLISVQNTTSTLQGIGDILLSALNLAKFQAVHGATWIQANGQSCVGTAYEALTTNKTVPTVTVSGATAYIKVNS